MALPLIRERRQFLSGLVFAIIGLAAFLQAQQFEMGTLTQMGAGYYPACLGAALFAIGVALVAHSVLAGAVVAIGHVALRDMVFLLSGVVAFALLIERTGLAEAVCALVVFGCYNRIAKRPIEVLVICAILAAATVGLFIFALGIPVAIY